MLKKKIVIKKNRHIILYSKLFKFFVTKYYKITKINVKKYSARFAVIKAYKR